MNEIKFLEVISTHNTIKLKWESVDDSYLYSIRIKIDRTDTYRNIATLFTGKNRSIMNGITQDTPYIIEVRGFKGGEPADKNNYTPWYPVSVRTKVGTSDQPKRAPIVNLITKEADTKKVSLFWECESSPTGKTEYIIRYKKVGTEVYSRTSTEEKSISILRNEGTEYEFGIQTAYPNGNLSDWLTFTIKTDLTLSFPRKRIMSFISEYKEYLLNPNLNSEFVEKNSDVLKSLIDNWDGSTVNI
jgi:hypothetical protein